ncbi:MAG: ABC transporter substrate-binding protein [Micropruina sp.]|uniref:ABC transporter substrate-binding protein n=1 Tax=Micropruina sp. TaxID=2737536 RepID=UPI0039E52F8E
MPAFVRPLLSLVTAGCVAFAAGGCVRAPDPLPSPSTSSSGPPRPFTVLTVQKATTADPAAVRNDSDAMVALDLFQRLMLVQPSTQLLKPDLAKECLFTAERIFECTLPKELTFSSGHSLTSSDVKFSILRALRLAPQQMSMLGALRTIETPDPWTVRFRLKYPDNQFGYGLAAPAASIVDEESYDPDRAKPVDQMAIGSGPYQLESWDNKGLTITKFTQYKGALGTDMPRIRISWADSPTAENALADGAAEIVWRTLSPAAIDRLQGRIRQDLDDHQQPAFFRWGLPRMVLQRLVWLPRSSYRANATLRQAVSLALQEDRTAGSILPTMMEDHTDAFALGGNPKVPSLGRRISLTMRFTNTSPAMEDLAQRVRGRLEQKLGISVQLVTETERADLELRDSAPLVNTPLGWLQDYLKNPLPGSADKLAELEERVRSSSRHEVQGPALGEIQKQAAVDATVVPIAEAEGVLFLRQHVDLVGEALGPGWQLALWGARWRN